MNDTYNLSTRKSWNETQLELDITMEKWGVKNWETNYPRGAKSEKLMQSDAERTVKLTYIKNGKASNPNNGQTATSG